ncbi:MAG: response regulator, partial [Dehalococcoidia bacterium]
MNDQPIKVLLVEDNAGDARLMRELLAEEDSTRFDVTHAWRLGEALDRLSSNAYHVVLLDLGLPDSHGIETLGLVRAQAPAVPIVVLTGFDDSVLALEAVCKGAQLYLVKGEHVDDVFLKRAIDYAIEQKRAEEAMDKPGPGGLITKHAVSKPSTPSLRSAVIEGDQDTEISSSPAGRPHKRHETADDETHQGKVGVHVAAPGALEET